MVEEKPTLQLWPPPLTYDEASRQLRIERVEGNERTLNLVAVKVLANSLTMMATSAVVPGSTVQTAVWAELGAPR